jgi:hypothetical protein
MDLTKSFFALGYDSSMVGAFCRREICGLVKVNQWRLAELR